MAAAEDRPPTPKALSIAIRLLELAIFALTAAWILGPLNGLAFAPKELAGGLATDTNALFNWHPLLQVRGFPGKERLALALLAQDPILLQVLGFAVFMTEALLAYQAPVVKDLDRWAATRLSCLLLQQYHQRALLQAGQEDPARSAADIGLCVRDPGGDRSDREPHAQKASRHPQLLQRTLLAGLAHPHAAGRPGNCVLLMLVCALCPYVH